MFLQYSDEVWSKLGKSKMVNSKHFENHTSAASWWRYNFAHNCHIDAIGFIHRTNHLNCDQIRQCMWTFISYFCLSILAITSSPRHGQTVWDSKIPPQFSIPNVLRSRSLTHGFGARVLKILGGVFQIPEHVIFKQPWIADFLLGGAHDMQRKSCSAWWDLYVYRVSYEYVQVCVSYSSSFLMVFQGAL